MEGGGFRSASWGLDSDMYIYIYIYKVVRLM